MVTYLANALESFYPEIWESIFKRKIDGVYEISAENNTNDVFMIENTSNNIHIVEYYEVNDMEYVFTKETVCDNVSDALNCILKLLAK